MFKCYRAAGLSYLRESQTTCIVFCLLNESKLERHVPGRAVLSVAANRGGDGFWDVPAHGGLHGLSLLIDTVNPAQPTSSIPTSSTACGPPS